MDVLPFSSPPAAEVFYPCRDGEPMAETEAHLIVMLTVIATLRQHFADNPDVYVVGNMFLYWEEGNPKARKAPDVMAARGVEPRDQPRDFFKTWEEGVVPCTIVEMTSRGTAQEDVEEKRELYQRIGVKEYFLFDPKEEYLERQLMGFSLSRGVYEPLIPAADGGLLSNELMVRFVPDGWELALFDFRTGKRIPTPGLTHRLWREAEAETARLRRVAEEAERQVQQAERQAQQAERQVQQAERQREEAERQREEAERQREEAERQREEAERFAESERQQREEAQRLAGQERQEKEDARRREAEAEKRADDERIQKEEALRQAAAAGQRLRDLEAELNRLRQPPSESPPMA